MYMCVQWVLSVVSNSLWSPGLQLSWLLCPCFPGKKTGVGCHFLLQGIFWLSGGTRVSCISCTVRQILYHCTTWEAQVCACVSAKIKKVILKKTFEQRPEKRGVESYKMNMLDTMGNMTYERHKIRMRIRQKTERVKGTWMKMSLGWQERDRAGRAWENGKQFAFYSQWVYFKSRKVEQVSNMIQFSSIQSPSHVQLCDFMNCSTPGFPVHHQLPLAQTHVHRVGDAIQPPHPLSSPSPPVFNLSQYQGVFQRVSSSHQVAKVLEFQLQHQSSQWIFRTDFL